MVQSKNTPTQSMKTVKQKSFACNLNTANEISKSEKDEKL